MRSLARSTRLPLVRQLRCARFRRMRPLGEGRPRGTPVVRHYWTEFLTKHESDIRGHGLEVGTTETIRRFGRARLTRADAIDLEPHNADVTVVADLTAADEVPFVRRVTASMTTIG